MVHFPNEILSHIFSYLLTEREKHRLHDDTIGDSLDVRLLLETDSIRTAVRRVAIETAPFAWEGDSRYISFCPDSWLRDGHWPEFNSAISRICDLPNLDCLEVRFSSFCDEEVFPGALHEPSFVRKKTLEAISKTLRDRESRPDTSIIRELVLNCLEDTPLLKDLNDNLLHNIDKLHIRVAYDDDENERPEFVSYLSGTLLPSISEHLVELTIAGHCWGSIPAEFNGQGLSFSCLKSLTLGEYIILRQDQFKWILEQRSLISLNLYSCKIATHCLVSQPDFEDWGVNLNGWKRLPDSSTNMGQANHSPMSHTHLEPLDPGWYTNDLQWSDIFDRIRQDLPELRNINFKCSSWENYFEGYPEILNHNGLHNRYYTFNGESWGWVLYLPAEQRPWSTERDYFKDKDMPGTPVGLYERTQSADRYALVKLMEATHKRRGEKQCTLEGRFVIKQHD
ncbi:hypothetical protein F52700_2576 [Fusarium sp. NRRL 52700]|nr:hypothetical protein F52700_2576 [Fusarium sp. NRRL 52700]